MGYGDQLMGTGLAVGAAARGKRIAFGDGKSIIWDHQSAEIFKNNPNIAPPGSEGANDLEWVSFYRGHRIYNSEHNGKWVWNYDFKATPGELSFLPDELDFARRVGGQFIVVEPNVPAYKGHAANKRWPFDRYQKLTDLLIEEGHDVRQFVYSNSQQLVGVKAIRAPSFRHALAALSQAKLYVGPEGGMHHGAAAVGIRAVVIFGSFIPPQVTGYDSHTNIAVGEACGSLRACDHCFNAMLSIKVKHVHAAIKEQLRG